MKHVVSFSGGRTSAYLVYLMEQKRLHEGWDVNYVFMDTGAEHPKTYDFIRNLVKYWRINLTCLRVKINPILGKGNEYVEITLSDLRHDLEPWFEMVKKYGTPSAVSPYCTSRMKTEPHDKYCKNRFGVEGKDFTTWLGIRSDEQRRIKNRKGIRYLAELSNFEKKDVIEWWSNQEFDLEIPEWSGNCVFCIKKSFGKLALAARENPDLYHDFLEMSEGPHVRTENLVHGHKRMFRGSKHLSDIIPLYDELSEGDIRLSLRGQKHFQSGSCSESCEAFNEDSK